MPKDSHGTARTDDCNGVEHVADRTPERACFRQIQLLGVRLVKFKGGLF